MAANTFSPASAEAATALFWSLDPVVLVLEIKLVVPFVKFHHAKPRTRRSPDCRCNAIKGCPMLSCDSYTFEYTGTKLLLQGRLNKEALLRGWLETGRRATETRWGTGWESRTRHTRRETRGSETWRGSLHTRRA